MKRLLCIANIMNTGGAETFLMKLYRSIDREKYQFDFCVSEEGTGFYDSEILAMGGRIHHITGKSRNPLRCFLDIYRLVKREKYAYVLRFGQNSVTMLDLVAAKMAGAQRCIYRSANSNIGSQSKKALLLHKLFSPLCKIVPDRKIAPSDLAAEFMFGKEAVENNEVLMLKNGIPVSQFCFSEADRLTVRKEFGLAEDAFVVGHIGRFAPQKNHRKVIDVFHSLQAVKPESHLILVGQGKLESDVRQWVEALELTDYVHFAGVRPDVARLLSAFDVLLLPSFYEGMPNTIIEAQANGVPCVISDTITKTVKINNNVSMLPLDADNQVWCSAICEAVRIDSASAAQNMLENGYEISQVARTFLHFVIEN